MHPRSESIPPEHYDTDDADAAYLDPDHDPYLARQEQEEQSPAAEPDPGPGPVQQDASGRRLRSVPPAEAAATDSDSDASVPYSAHVAATAAWNDIRVKVKTTEPVQYRAAPPSARVAALMGAYFSPLRWRDSVFVVPRTSDDPSHVPTGGVLLNVDSGYIRQRAAARYRAMTNQKEVPSKSAISDGITAIAGTAADIAATPYTRWGRAVDGALWWDSGEKFVRVDQTGWEVRDTPDTYFVRPTGTPVLTMPSTGGSIDPLWNYARVEEADRPLIIAWMLQQADPDYESACPLLYLTGQHGAAKSTAATVIAMACGDAPERDIPKDIGDKPTDFLVSLSGTHITLLDNLSHLSAAASDVMCVAITGGTSRQRKLFTDTDLVYLRLRKPLIATSIDLGTIRDDLAERMIAVRLPLAPTGLSRKSEKRLMAAFRQAQPGIFGALLDLMVKVLAADTPQVPLPRLAAFGETAARLDVVTGSESLARLDELMAGVAGRSVDEDPFWSTVYEKLGQDTVTHTAAELLALTDPDGDLAHKHRKGGWPANGRSLGQRMERVAPTLRAVGWRVVRHEPDPGARRGVTWTLCPRPGHSGCPADCTKEHEPRTPHVCRNTCPRGCTETYDEPPREVRDGHHSAYARNCSIAHEGT